MTEDSIQAENTPKTSIRFEVCRAEGEPTIRHEFALNPDGSIGARIGEPMEVIT